jgi:hypothetical protein
MANLHTSVAAPAVTSSKGNAIIPNAGYKVAGQVMPRRIPNRPWYPNWHPKHPSNNISILPSK